MFFLLISYNTFSVEPFYIANIILTTPFDKLLCLQVKVIPPIKSLPNTRTGGTTSKSFKNYNEKRKKQASDLDRAFASALSTSAVNCGNWRANPISAPEEGGKKLAQPEGIYQCEDSNHSIISFDMQVV